MRAFLTLFVLLLATAAHAQQRQPANVSTLPTTTPQEFDLLDNQGRWMPFGTSSGGVFTGNGAGTDVRSFGCVADGITDQTACINNALANASDCVIIPATQNGFYVAGTITVTKCLRGTSWLPQLPSNGYAGSSYLVCNNQVAQPCVVVNRGNKYAAQIENLTITANGTPVDDSIGLQWQNGFNLIVNNALVDNFGSCVYLGPTAAAGVSPISTHMNNLMLGRCHKHWLVNDGIPEVYLSGGRWGQGADYDTADDYVFSTKTAPAGGGGGPNTLVIDSIQINGGAPGCVFRWGGFTATGGVFGANKIVNSHIEFIGSNYTGSASRGLFCTDSTVTTIPETQMANSDFADDGGTKTMPVFNFDPASNFGNGSMLAFIGNKFLAAATSLSVHNELFSFGPTLTGNWFFSPFTFTAGDNSATAQISDNTFFGGYTIAGAWSRLKLSNNIGTMTDTATGSVFVGGDLPRTWVPTLAFGGGSVGLTYNFHDGTVARTPGGGFRATGRVALTAKGTSTGTAIVSGLPYTCATGSGIQPPIIQSAFAGLTGALFTSMSATPGNVAFVQSSATGFASVGDTNFTNTTNVQFTVECVTAQ